MGSAESGAHRAYTEVHVNALSGGTTSMTALATSARTLFSPPPRRIDSALERVLTSQRSTRCNLSADRPTTLDVLRAVVRVPGIARDVRVKIASERKEWEEAYRLVAQTYRNRGYEPANARGLRFTAFHALPDTTTFVAAHDDQVVATLSLVVDNTLLGLPMESIYGPEVQALRHEGRRLGEVISLADSGLGVREFLQVFISLIKLMVHYHVSHGGDTCVISVNPRHRNFYSKVIGFVPLGPVRSYPCVQDAPAEAYVVDLKMMKANAPKMYEEIASQAPAPESLTPRAIPPHLVRYFGNNSSQTNLAAVQEILEYVGCYGTPRRW
jgi:hypothetical protein